MCFRVDLEPSIAPTNVPDTAQGRALTSHASHAPGHTAHTLERISAKKLLRTSSCKTRNQRTLDTQGGHLHAWYITESCATDCISTSCPRYSSHEIRPRMTEKRRACLLLTEVAQALHTTDAR
jgi:hypothetical protein